MNLDMRTLIAHADAWQSEGVLRASLGGGVLDVRGARLSASGLPFAKWNSGDVHDAAAFDVDAARAWYATRAFGQGVPWGMRVPEGEAFPFGRHLTTVRSMALEPLRFDPAPPPPGVTLREATPEEAQRVGAIDAAAFEEPLEESLTWNAPHFGARGFVVALAIDGGTPVATAELVLSNGRAGKTATIFGVAVLDIARRRGVGAAMTAWLVERAFAHGATLAHLCPNHDAAARVYARLGFVPTRGFDVYVDL